MEGIKLIVTTLGGVWGKTALEDQYSKFERAIYGVAQKQDETNDSYVARHEVIFEDLAAQGASLSEMRAYILLRNSTLSPEDKKRVIVDAQGHLKYDTVVKAIRMLGARFFHEVQGQQKNYKSKTYDVNYMQESEEDCNYADEVSYAFAAEVTDLTDNVLDHFLAEGDEDALVVQQFEEALIDAVQGDAEMGTYMSTYLDARKRLTEKTKNRGFWPSRGKGGGGKKGKSKFFPRGRKPLAVRIAESECRLCGQRGHWKAECPRRTQPTTSTSGTSKPHAANVMISVNSELADDEADVYVMASNDWQNDVLEPSADEDCAVNSKKTQDQQDRDVMKMSFEELGRQVILFGEAKKGQKFSEIVNSPGGSNSVPSAFYIADAFLYLDLILKKQLFKPKTGDADSSEPEPGSEQGSDDQEQSDGSDGEEVSTSSAGDERVPEVHDGPENESGDDPSKGGSPCSESESESEGGCEGDLIDELLRTDPDLVSNPHFADYFDYVLQSLMKFGDSVSDRMVSRYHYFLWDPLNHARQLMNMPVEPVLADDDPSDKEMPPAKRPKTGKVVEKAILAQPLGEVGKRHENKATGAAVTSKFGQFDLEAMGIPTDAWPQADVAYKGSKSFTVKSRTGAVPYLQNVGKR
eukprot:s552_g48.t2